MWEQDNFSMCQYENYKTDHVTEGDLQGVGEKDSTLAQVMGKGGCPRAPDWVWQGHSLLLKTWGCGGGTGMYWQPQYNPDLGPDFPLAR